MFRPAQSLARLLAALSVASLLAACSGSVPEPLVWKARDVVVLPIDGGRQVQALWVRKGVSLMARHRTDGPVAMDDLLIDRQRELVWLRDRGTLKALTFPELELFAQLPVDELVVGPLSLVGDGSVALGEARFQLAGQLLQRAPVRAASHGAPGVPPG